MRLDLPEPEMPVTQMNSPSGKLTSILRRLFSRAPFTVRQWPLPVRRVWGDWQWRLRPEEIVAGNAALGLADILYAACGYDLAAVHTGTGAYVHDIVRAAHGVLVVLYHDDRVAQIPQVFQGSDKLIVVPLMQADGSSSST